MKELIERIERLVVSRPVFILRKGPSWRPDSFELQCAYPAGNAFMKNDAVGRLVVESAHEQFNIREGKYEINVDNTLNTINNKILNSARYFIEKNSNSDKVHNTKLYKWYSDSAQYVAKSEFLEAMFMLYKYMESNQGISADSTHAKNIMSILEILKSKFGENDDTT